MGRTSALLDSVAAFALTTRNVVVQVPQTAKAAVFHWNMSTVAGTTPVADCKLQCVDPSSGTFVDIDGGAFGQQTAASYQVLQIGLGLPAEATGNFRSSGAALPVTLRVLFTFDRTTGDETYSFTLNVDWIS